MTTTELEELGPLVTELKRRAESGDDGTRGLGQIAPPWTCDGARVALALAPLTPAYRLWRPAICYARGPVNRRAQGPTGGWITVIGVGTRTAAPAALQSLRASTRSPTRTKPPTPPSVSTSQTTLSTARSSKLAV